MSKGLDALPLTRWQRLGFKLLNAVMLLLLMQWSPLWPMLAQALGKYTEIQWMALPAMERTIQLLAVYPLLIKQPVIADALLPDLIGILAVASVYLVVVGWLSRQLTVTLASLWLASRRSASPVVKP